LRACRLPRRKGRIFEMKLGHEVVDLLRLIEARKRVRVGGPPQAAAGIAAPPTGAYALGDGEQPVVVSQQPAIGGVARRILRSYQSQERE